MLQLLITGFSAQTLVTTQEIVPLSRDNGMYLPAIGIEYSNHDIPDLRRRFRLDLLDQRKAGLAFDQIHDGHFYFKA